MNIHKCASSLLGIIFLFAFLQAPQAQESAYIADHLRSFKDGKTLFNLGTYTAAQDQLYSFLKATKDFSMPEYKRLQMEAEFLIAQCALRLGQSNAETLLLSFVKSYKPDPYAIKAITEIATYYYDRKEYDKALGYFKKIDLYSISESERTETRFKMGYSELVLKNFRSAKSHFQLIKNIEGIYYYPANYYLAMSEYFLENYDEALKGFKAVEQSRRYRDLTPYYISNIYFLQERYQELIPYAEESLQKPGIKYRGEIRYLLGQAYFKDGNYEKALPLLESQARDGMRPEDIYPLAYSYYKNERYKEAAKYFKKIASEEGRLGQNSNFYLAVSYIKMGNKPDARIAFANAYRNNYNDKIAAEALFNYGKISAELQYDREAVNALQSFQPSSQFYIPGQKVLSELFYNTRDYANSIGVMEEMENLSPDLKKAYQHITLNYGLLKLKNGENTEAYNLLNKSLKYPISTADKLQALYWKAYLNYIASQYDESITDLNRYFTLLRSSDPKIPVNSSEASARYLQGYNYFKTAKYSLASGQFGRAISLIRLTEGPAEYLKNIEPDALVRQGDCLFKENKYKEAIDRYDQALNLKYTQPTYALYQKAIIYGLQKEIPKKILYLNQIVDRYPNATYADEALYELGKTYQALEKYDQAIPPLRELVNNYKGKSPLVNSGLLSLGLIAYNQGDVTEALKYYKQVVANNPDKKSEEEALFAIKEIYIQDIGNPSEYVSYLEDVGGREIKIETRDSLTFNSANLAFESGNYEKAISNFTEYIQEFPRGVYKTRAHYYRAESFAVMQDYKQALRDYEFVVSQGTGTYYLSAVEKAAKIAYNSTEEFNKALRYYETLERNSLSEEKRFQALIGGMEAAYRSGNHEVVRRKAEKISSNPHASQSDIAKAQYYRGKTAMQQNKYDEALNAFNQVMQYSNDKRAAEAKYSIARIYYLRQEYDLAHSLAEKAYKESTAYPYWVAKSLLVLADVYIIQDDTYNARAAVEAIIENYQDDPDILREAENKLEKIKSLQNKQKNKSDDGLLQMEEN